MLQGAPTWPAEAAARCRSAGPWEDTCLFDRRSQAARLLALGIGPFDRMVVPRPNISEFVPVYFALVSIGAIPVMALRAHRHAEVCHFPAVSGAKAHVIPDRIGRFDNRAMAEALRDDAPHLQHVIVVGKAQRDQRAFASLMEGPTSEAARLALDATRAEPGEVATMLLSGGTISMSKLIPRTTAITCATPACARRPRAWARLGRAHALQPVAAEGGPERRSAAVVSTLESQR